MALTKEQRIAISKKIVNIPILNAASDSTKAELAKVKAEFENQDDANRALLEDQNILINAYQAELNRYDGNARTVLIEQDFLDSVDRIKNNPFFPNDPQLSLPSLSNGVWVNFIPFANTKAIGKDYDEQYNSTTKEEDLITDIQDAIALVESFSNPTRSTGQECNESGTCDLPQYTNESDCTSNGGTWTVGPDIISNDTAMQAAGNALITAVQAWEDFLNATYALIPSIDTEPSRAAENDVSRLDITNAIVEIDSWQALSDYDTTHGASTCDAFDSLDVSTLDQTKFRADSIQILTDEITARLAFITTRSAEINGHLGSITQNVSTGSFTVDGFYGNRFRFIDLRLNAVAGSLTRLKGLERGEKAQDQIQEANANAEAAYTSVIKATAFRSPATNTNSIHVMSSSDFSMGDTVYIVSDTQEEIQTTILFIDGNRIALNIKIPEKYRNTEYARIYKVV